MISLGSKILSQNTNEKTNKQTSPPTKAGAVAEQLRAHDGSPEPPVTPTQGI